MKSDNETLIEELLALTEKSTLAAEKFKRLPDSRLNFKSHPGRWSVLECIEHLNRYGEFYLPEIEKALLSRKETGAPSLYKSGMIGGYFAKLMKVRNGKMFKMKTPADKNPLGVALSATTIERFLEQQEKLKSLLVRARHSDLTKTKVPISLTKFIKLRLGDTLKFFVYHIERHILQAQREVNGKS